MNKSELIDTLSLETGFDKGAVSRLLRAFQDNVARALEKGDKIQLSGFGTFTLSRRGARKGINPQTKETIQLPEIFVPKFKPGKNFKEVVNRSKKGRC
ncbi:MAG: HU family DNA-binding protein [Candidatus Babeliaceae bacterium]|nr:HU family DNA-binding protein [Candidatus Babeliaceae bacterium]